MSSEHEQRMPPSQKKLINWLFDVQYLCKFKFTRRVSADRAVSSAIAAALCRRRELELAFGGEARERGGEAKDSATG